MIKNINVMMILIRRCSENSFLHECLDRLADGIKQWHGGNEFFLIAWR